jgi:DNA-binding MarR family transcriptional regulator
VQDSVLLSVSLVSGADQRTIGAVPAVEPTTMANLPARMEKNGMVVRTADPLDGRRYRLTLSALQRGELEAATPVVRSIRDDSWP